MNQPALPASIDAQFARVFGTSSVAKEQRFEFLLSGIGITEVATADDAETAQRHIFTRLTSAQKQAVTGFVQLSKNRSKL